MNYDRYSVFILLSCLHTCVAKRTLNPMQPRIKIATTSCSMKLKEYYKHKIMHRFTNGRINVNRIIPKSSITYTNFTLYSNIVCNAVFSNMYATTM